MGILAWIIVGLLAGVLAKVVMPGGSSEPGGFLGTMLLGIVGAVIGGWVWSMFFARTGVTGFDLGSILVATVGACITIGLLRLLRRQSV